MVSYYISQKQYINPNMLGPCCLSRAKALDLSFEVLQRCVECLIRVVNQVKPSNRIICHKLLLPGTLKTLAYGIIRERESVAHKLLVLIKCKKRCGFKNALQIQ